MAIDIKGAALPPSAFQAGDSVIVDNAGSLRKVTIGDLAAKSIPGAAVDPAETDTLLAVRDGALVRITQPDASITDGAEVEEALEGRSDAQREAHLHAMIDDLVADDQAVIKTAAGIDGFTLGSAAGLEAAPTGAPATATSESAAITLDFEDDDELASSLTEDVTVAVNNLPAYATGVWYVQQDATGRNVTFPAGSVMFGTDGDLTYGGTANAFAIIVIYNDGSKLWVTVNEGGVGA